MYRGIEQLRSINDVVVNNTEETSIISLCAVNAEYFIRNYCYINTKDNGLTLFNLRPRQARELPELLMHRWVKGDWYRQSGYTTLVMAFLLWVALFTPNQMCLYMAPKKGLAYGNFDILRQMYIHLPFWMQKGVLEWSKSRIVLENGSILKAAPASERNARGIGWNYIFIDEFGYIKDKAMTEIVSGLFKVVESSNKTHVILANSQRFGKHTPANTMFWENTTIPFYVTELTWKQDGQHDEAWAEDMRRRIGYMMFEQEYCGTVYMSVPSKKGAQFGRWVTGRYPEPKSYNTRYLCAIGCFYKSGEIAKGPYSKVLTLDSSGKFVGLEKTSNTTERVLGWMPTPNISASMLKHCL